MKNVTNKMQFCCYQMEFQIEEQQNGTPESIGYDPVYREFWMYSVKMAKETDNEILGSTIDYCPFCGIKLPKLLSDEYSIELEKVLGRKGYEALFYYKDEGAFKECPVLDRNKVPEEFKTDEWWIKRGL